MRTLSPPPRTITPGGEGEPGGEGDTASLAGTGATLLGLLMRPCLLLHHLQGGTTAGGTGEAKVHAVVL